MSFAQGFSHPSFLYYRGDLWCLLLLATLLKSPLSLTTLNILKERVTSESIISDRMPRHDRHGNTQVKLVKSW
jgi:hypothetical protein